MEMQGNFGRQKGPPLNPKGMIDNIKMHVTPFVVMSCDSICPDILVCSK